MIYLLKYLRSSSLRGTRPAGGHLRSGCQPEALHHSSKALKLVEKSGIEGKMPHHASHPK